MPYVTPRIRNLPASVQKNFAAAVPYCQKALAYTPQDLWANYRLGTIYIEQSNQNASPALPP